MHKYSISSNFSSLDYEESMQRMSRQGFHYVELSFEHSQEFLRLGQPAEIGAQKKQFAADLGLSILQGHLLFPAPADLADTDPVRLAAQIDEWKRELELFEALGIRNAVLHPGGEAAFFLGWPIEKIADIRTAALRQLAEFTKGSGVRVCLENLICGRYMSVSDQLLDAIDRTGMDNLGIILDTGHLNVRGDIKESPGDFIRKCGKRLHALHLQDNHGKADEHLFPLDGTIDFKEVAAALREVGYDDLYNLEIPGEAWVLNAKFPSLLEDKTAYARRLLETIFPD